MRAAAIVIALASASTAWGAFGGFGPAVLYTANGTNGPQDVQAADLTGDGKAEIVTVSNVGLSVFLNDGMGTLTRVDYTVGTSIPWPTDRVILVDLDGDGDLDVAGTDRNRSRACVAFNDGSGGYSGNAGVTVANAPTSLAAGDIDGDTDPDLAVVAENGAGIALLINDGSGVFTLSSTIGVAAQPRGIAMGRFDVGASVDIAFAVPTSNRVFVLTNDGAGNFAAGTDFAAGSAQSELVAADIDNDTDLDFVTAGGTSNFYAFRNDGTGVFTPFGTYASGDNNNKIALADVDGDGWLDAVLAQINTGLKCRVFLNNGTGGFGAPIDYAASANVNDLAVGDIDGSSTPDLVTATRASARVEIRLNQTDVVPPGVFALQSPPDATQNLPLPEQLGWPGTQAKVRWGVASGFINTYQLQIASDAGFSNIVFQQPGLVGTEFVLPGGSLLEGTRHYWRVQATNQAGATFSNIFTFTTPCGSDANADGQVNAADLSVLLSQFGGACPK